jgi:flagellar protein FliL
MAEPEEEVAETPEVEKKSKLGLWLIIGAAILLLGGVGFVTRTYLGGAKGKKVEPESTGPSAKVKSILNLDAFLVNLADADAARFVKVTFRLGLDEAKLGEEYASNQVVLAATRDKIISLLSTKTSEDMLSAEGKDRLRKEIMIQVNPVLPKGRIVEVFIMDFVVQL